MKCLLLSLMLSKNRDLSGGYVIGKIHYQDKPEFPLSPIDNIGARKRWNSESNLVEKWFNLKTDLTYMYNVLKILLSNF